MFWSHSVTLFTFLLFFPSTLALPTPRYNTLEPRGSTACKGGGFAPCICKGHGDPVGIRYKDLDCPARGAVYANKKDENDGNLKLTKNKEHLEGAQCDHQVELGFIAGQIEATDGACDHLTKNPQALKDLKHGVNHPNNLAYVEGAVNKVKGDIINEHAKLEDHPIKAISGGKDYITHLKNGADGTSRDFFEHANAQQHVADTLQNSLGMDTKFNPDAFKAAYQAKLGEAANGMGEHLAKAKEARKGAQAIPSEVKAAPKGVEAKEVKASPKEVKAAPKEVKAEVKASPKEVKQDKQDKEAPKEKTKAPTNPEMPPIKKLKGAPTNNPKNQGKKRR